MIVEIVIPSPGESIAEVELVSWLANDGEYVEKNQEIAEVESDKATLPLIAQEAGKLNHKVEEGKTIAVGTVACTIDTSAKAPEKKSQPKKEEPEPAQKKSVSEKTVTEKPKETAGGDKKKSDIKATPLARKMMDEHALSVDDVVAGLKKITSKDVRTVLYGRENGGKAPERTGTREEHRESMSQLRKKLSQRLVAVKNETAMLTTFNEVDMSAIIALRKKYQKAFTEAHGIKLGFMSFFTKAVTEALLAFPKVNSIIDGDEIVSYRYVDVAIAVTTDKGLMVPVLRNTETMSLADMEKQIAVLADKARKFRLSIEEMSGGTFTITNGGIFGSMLSTPILNPPQAAILGMHNIVERPVAIDGKVEIRPVMYVALSYDHRLVDGRDSVSFLVKVKELLEAPYKMLFGGQDPEKVLLGV
ncbi:MAG: 2-oxoglutarate dehydrogenase complex dihydrolipoyllysine-residue succinyltransferase [Bacteroidales bacterium]|jgi:2-oxoglutarate dehydrogenase E2 component (dihydrolipoamide succinyltransferase)